MFFFYCDIFKDSFVPSWNEQKTLEQPTVAMVTTSGEPFYQVKKPLWLTWNLTFVVTELFERDMYFCLRDSILKTGRVLRKPPCFAGRKSEVGFSCWMSLRRTRRNRQSRTQGRVQPKRRRCNRHSRRWGREASYSRGMVTCPWGVVVCVESVE